MAMQKIEHNFCFYHCGFIIDDIFAYFDKILYTLRFFMCFVLRKMRFYAIF